MSFAAKEEKKGNGQKQNKQTPHTVHQKLSPKMVRASPLKLCPAHNRHLLPFLESVSLRKKMRKGMTSTNPWSPGGSFMAQKMVITSPIPVFYGLRMREGWSLSLAPALNPWSPGGSFIVQKMAIISPIPRLLWVKIK